MEKFFRCFAETIRAAAVGGSLVLIGTWALDIVFGTAIYNSIQSIPQSERLLLITVVFLGCSLGSAYNVFHGKFIDHKRFVRDSHWIHRNDVTPDR